MSATRTLNRDMAKQNPEGTFDSPFEIVEEKLFTKGRELIISTLAGLGQPATIPTILATEPRLSQSSPLFDLHRPVPPGTAREPPPA